MIVAHIKVVALWAHCPSITFYGATMGNESGQKRNSVGMLLHKVGQSAVPGVFVIVLVIVSVFVFFIAL